MTTESCTILFDANGGSGSMESQRISPEDAARGNISLHPSRFTKTGFRFAGWTAAGNAVARSIAEGSPFKHFPENSTVTLRAVWLPEEIEFSGTGNSIEITSCSTLFTGHLEIPQGVTSINDRAFCCCIYLKSIAIPASVSYIGSDAFFYCETLEHVSISPLATITSIREHTCDYCFALKSFTIPSSVTRIEDYAIQNCGALRHVAIPAGVTSIGDYAFFDSGLETVQLEAPTPPEIGPNAFRQGRNYPKIYVPSEALERYQSPWNTYSAHLSPWTAQEEARKRA